MSTLMTELHDYIDATFTGLCIETLEPDEAEREIVEYAAQREFSVLSWDIARGNYYPLDSGRGGEANTKNPLAPLGVFPGETKNQGGSYFVILHNYHKFLDNPQVCQGLFNAVNAGQGSRVFYFLLNPFVSLPTELDRAFSVFTHPRPTEKQLSSMASTLLEQNEYLQESLCDKVLVAAKGLTAREAKDSFSLSLIRHGKLDTETIWDCKLQAVRKKRFMEITRSKDGFDSLGGLTKAKEFALGLFKDRSEGLFPKGMLLLGVPGSGKDSFINALSYEIGLPVLHLDIGGMYHKHVGETESNVRQSLSIADGMGDVILAVKEIEKALSGVGNDGDSGVSNRLFGTLLNWLNDREEKNSRVVFFGSCNDVSKLPPEFSRAGRFDGIFFFDIPTVEERDCIWDIYLKKFNIPKNEYSNSSIDDSQWTGAEVRSCCRLSRLLKVPLDQAAKFVIPVARTYGPQITELRKWAKDNCLSASTSVTTPGLEINHTRKLKGKISNN